MEELLDFKKLLWKKELVKIPLKINMRNKIHYYQLLWSSVRNIYVVIILLLMFDLESIYKVKGVKSVKKWKQLEDERGEF